MLQIPYKSPIIPQAWGGEMQEIELKKLCSLNWGWNTGEKIVTSLVSVHLKLWVIIVIVIVNIRIKACACTSKNLSYINIIHNQIDNCYSVCPAAF